MVFRIAMIAGVALAIPFLAACDTNTRARTPTNPYWGAGLPPALADIPSAQHPTAPPQSPYGSR